MIKAILLMGGHGTRFGRSYPKQFALLGGKPVYHYALETLEASGLFDQIILVTPDGSGGIQGGQTRQESSYQGLIACGPKTEIVLIHDGVRPFVTREMLEANIEAARKYGAADTCIPSTDTLVHGTDIIRDIPPRHEYKRGQTPQTFRYELIREAHEKTCQRDATDDCQLVLEMGHPVRIVKGDETNIKITTELDLYLAEHILRMRSHPLRRAFSLTGKRFIITGGSGGIGSALAKALYEEGATPINFSRSTHIDLTSFKRAEGAFAEVGPVDGLINCIGFLKKGPLNTLSPADIDAMIAVNLSSTVYACRLAEIHPGGHIVNISSSSYTRGRQDYAIYSATKAAIVNFTQALSQERSDLYVNTLAPGRTDTEMRRQNFSTEENRELLSPDEVAQEIVAILKSNVTGTIVPLQKK